MISLSLVMQLATQRNGVGVAVGTGETGCPPACAAASSRCKAAAGLLEREDEARIKPGVLAALSRASPEVTECRHLVLQQQASPAAFIRLRCIAMALHILLGSAKNALLQAVVVCFRPGSSEVWVVLSRRGN